MISIIVSWRGRDELRLALPSLCATAKHLGGDLNIVNYSGCKQELAQQLGELSSDVNVINVENQKYFNKASAQNIGAYSTHQPFLFFCDCDIILDPLEVAEIVNRLSCQEKMFATIAGVSETKKNSRGANHVVSFGYELIVKTADGKTLRIVDNEEDSEDGTRQAPGLLFVSRENFLSINGYNSELHGWGWEDQDMISRLTLGAGLSRFTQGHVQHISHDDDARTAHYPYMASRWESRDKMFRKALQNYDENNFLGSYTKDIELVSEPTEA